MKTDAVRALDRLVIRYELREYDVDPSDPTAETVAVKVGLPAGQVFKTLVMRSDRHGVVLAVVPGDAKADPKAVARERGDRGAAGVPLREIEPLTGYVRGGLTALNLKRPYPVLLDETALGLDRISVSAGLRGRQVLLAPAGCVRAVGARVAATARSRARA
jgi:Cys-tRNA(Pro)/Cys-tRNA(Cys) deacylase